MPFEATASIMAGLTGGIASGKSTVAAMLREAGARIIDADRIAHQVVRHGHPAWQDIVRHFGSGILRPDGEIDRQALGAVVFNDREAKQTLNAIVHPRVQALMEQEISRLAAESPETPVILDVPLLIESGWHEFLPLVILVYVPEIVQKVRLMKRDGLSDAEAMARIQAQMPIDAKRRHADVIIDNAGTIEATRRQVQAIYEQILAGGWPAAGSSEPAQP